MAPEPVEPSRDRATATAILLWLRLAPLHPAKQRRVTLASPWACKRPPTSLLPPSRRPHGSSQGGHAQGVSALLQPASSRARLCPAQQPHGLWAKTKGRSAGLKPVKEQKHAHKGRASGGSGRPREDGQEAPPAWLGRQEAKVNPSLGFCPSELQTGGMRQERERAKVLPRGTGQLHRASGGAAGSLGGSAARVCPRGRAAASEASRECLELAGRSR